MRGCVPTEEKSGRHWHRALTEIRKLLIEFAET